ncbi:BMC domain-containing protein [Clostridium swellfunianum]|uniref:BMC domain-containing protein n=1 Tax=Clostridium swellfunianum TaxID=1367462 RepID=UPI00202F45F7|nr:BMC domain-containing protein [Clostridium swellfunianum]MCM0649231.1 BMC domain-containing protein [Clostridium swellfunianum]
MKQYEAVGIVDVKYYTLALQVLDAMCKASEVEFLGSEKALGGRLVTIIVGGSISNVQAAVEAAREVCEGREDFLKNAVVITRPHEEIMKFIVKNEVSKTKELPKKKKNKKLEESNEEFKQENEE